MRYCRNGTDLTYFWRDQGINECLLNTITSGLLLLVILLFGCVQCRMYDKYATALDKKFVRTNLGSVLQIFLTLILILESASHIIAIDLMKEHGGVCGVDILTFLCLFIAWLGTLRLLSLERKRMLPTIPTRGHGLVLLTFWTLAVLRENLPFISWWSKEWWWYLNSDADHMEFVLWVVRYSCVCLLFLIGLKAPGLSTHTYSPLNSDEDIRLTGSKDKQGGSPQLTWSKVKKLRIMAPYVWPKGSWRRQLGLNNGPDIRLTGSKDKQGGSPQSTWSNVLKKLRIMAPYVWPKGSWWRQLIVLGCLVILAAGRGINVLVPIFNKDIVNSLTTSQTPSTEKDVKADSGLTFRWDLILIYSGLIFLKGGGTGGAGFLNNARTFLWIPVQQYTTRRVQVKLFSHLHALSLSWHLQRKTGEVLRVVDRGTNSINNLLNYVIFQILPTVIDIVIAIVYFITAFNYIFGVTVFMAMGLYLAVTVFVTEWRTKYRREMNTLDNATNSTAVDSLLNFETVKYYGASQFEIDRYNKAILKYQKAEWKATASLNLLNTVQNIVVTGGILAGSLLCAWAVVHSLNGLKLTVGDYVLFGTYILQLYGPLNFLGTYYRMIQQAFIDMENMFDLLDVGVDVQDIPDAKDLQIEGGMIEFKNVKFHYDPEKPILKDISFTVPPGQTYALVGHSGSGKSTIIRLLFRFYDIQSGTIKIDDQNIALVKQESLRSCIGVVPQDTVLFNNDIMYNIRYGRIGADDSEVQDAADAADIHQRIQTFPRKYETVVGERGLKLSGGEKQRVAIARTLLKAPAIVLLDEATSALDTKTERNIQSSLARVCENRTTIIVAHRLSTIIHSNMILVMDEGEIVERGTHEELLARQGHYCEMWQQQLTKLDEDNGSPNNGEEIAAEIHTQPIN